VTAQYIGWALIVGLVVGGALVLFAIGRLPRSAEEMTDDERNSESAWISDAIAARGGAAAPELVDEVLALHARYLERDAPEGV